LILTRSLFINTYYPGITALKSVSILCIIKPSSSKGRRFSRNRYLI